MTTGNEIPDWIRAAAATSEVRVAPQQTRIRVTRNTIQLAGTAAGAWLIKAAAQDGLITDGDVEMIRGIIGDEGITAGALFLGAALYTVALKVTRWVAPGLAPWLEGHKAFPIYIEETK